MAIQYSKQALKFLKKQDTIVQKRLIKAIHLLPEIGDVKRLQGRDGYRLRVGDYRILFHYHTFEVLYIEKIDNRGQVYK